MESSREKIMKDRWKYKIGSGKTPVFLSLIMFAVFGSLSIWLYIAKNGAFIFGAMLAAVMLAVLILTVYRYFFYKVLIGRDGFYYQTQINNGAYYPYTLIRKAWISSGKNLSGHQQDFCNLETPNRKVIRFQFFYADTKGVQYLVKCAEAAAVANVQVPDTARQEYRIDDKQFGKSQIVLASVLVVMVLVLSASALRTGIALPGLLGIIMALIILGVAIVRYFCFQIQIGEQGFYYQTTPFNGTYFNYTDIERCWEVEWVTPRRRFRRRANAKRLHYFYFYFTHRDGSTRRFQFEQDMFGHEVNVLKDRIERQE